MKIFEKISADEIKNNSFELIGKDWCLITAGNKDSYNSLTASWGGLGVLWFKNVCTIYVRPSRYTYEFIEKNDYFTLSFLGDKHRDILNFFGKNSGRDIDKVKETGLTPVSSENGSVFYNEASLVVECKKLYFQDLDPSNFLDETIMKNYPNENFHRVYIGEITSVLKEESK